jgi:hypothetical protein
LIISGSDIRLAIIHALPSELDIFHALLPRTRDTSARVRRAAYLRLPPGRCIEELGGLELRTLAGHGLRDPDPSVRNAARKLLLEWYDLGVKSHGLEGSENTSFRTLVRFSRLFITPARAQSNASDVCATELVMEALKAVFLERPKVFRDLTFDGESYDRTLPVLIVLCESDLQEHGLKQWNPSHSLAHL